MRLYELSGNGLEALRLVERPSPRPGPGEVLVRMRAATLNYRDLMIATGRYGRGPLKRPLVPLSDGAGVVTAVGPGVRGLSAGDRVAGSFFQRWVDGPYHPEKGQSALGGAMDGVLAEEVLLHEGGAVKVPQAMSFEEAAAFPCAAVTAWVGLVVNGGLRAGETVLALGTGGVSIFALQIGKLFGARVVLTSSRDDKLARGRAIGADETLNYRTTPDWGERAHALTGGRGVDHVLEVGGAKTLPQSLAALREGGHLSLVGLLSGARADPDAAAKNGRGIRVDSIYVGSAHHLEEVLGAFTRAKVRPVVDRVFPFEEVPLAYRCLERGEHVGKIAIRI